MKPSPCEIFDLGHENGEESCDVDGCFFCPPNLLPVFGVRPAYANGLVYNEEIGVGVPPIRVEFRRVGACNVAWAKFH
jgi:hypothetical protein